MPRSPGGRLDSGRLVGGRIDWSGGPRARASRLAARSTWFGIGVVGSYGSYYQPQFFPLTADDTLGTSDAASRAPIAQPRTASDALGTSDAAARLAAQPRTAADSLGGQLLDSFTDASAPRDLTTYNGAWSAPAVSGEFSPKTTVGGAVTGLAGNLTSAYYPSVSQADVRISATVTTKPADGSWLELLARVQNPGTGALNCYLLVAFANAGTDSIELYKFVGGAGSQLRVFQSADYSAGDVLALDVTGTTISFYKNGVLIDSGTDLTVTGAGTVGIRLLDNSGALDNVGIGTGGVSDAAVASVTKAPQTGADTLGTSDVATRAATVRTRTAADTLGTSDVATRSLAQPRSAADSLGTSDAAARAPVARTRTGADSLGTSDSAARAPLAQPRTASDAVGPTYDPTIDLDSPVSHWKMGSTTSAVDRKGTRDLPAAGGGLAVVPGVTLKAGPDLANEAVGVTSARFFAGTGAGFGTPYEGPYTMEAWIKPTAGPSGRIIERAPGSYLGLSSFGGGSQVNALVAYEDSVGGQFTFLNAGALTVGSIYHLVASHDGSTVILYVNGAENNRASGVNGNRSSTTIPPTIVGARAGVWPFVVVDEVAWYNGALAPARVLAHYQAGTGALPMDVATRALALPRAAADTLGTSDAAAVTGGGTPNRSASDSLGTSDAATRAATVRTRAAADSLGTSDAATRTTAQPRAATDSLGTSDAATRAPVVRARTATDSLGTSDVASRSLAQPRTAGDTLATSDLATRAVTVRVRTAVDSLGTSDVATRVVLRTRTGADSLGTTDAATRAATVRTRTALDTLGTSDAAFTGSSPIRTASDALGTSDAATRASTLRARTATDTLGTSDVASRAIARARSSSDVLGTSDLATRVASYARFGLDVLGTTDGSVRSPVSFGRLASDTLGTSDQVARIAVSYRFAVDELGTSDSAAVVLRRFASDTLGTSDQATVTVRTQVAGTVLVTDSASALLSISDRPQLELALSSSALTISDQSA